MNVSLATDSDAQDWDDFLQSQPFSPFLQSWTMGEVYRSIGQEPIRLIATDGDRICGIVFGHTVPARRGKHVSVPYGPVLAEPSALKPLLDALSALAKEQGCSFIRLSPFWPAGEEEKICMAGFKAKASPLHLLAEHLWYLPLSTPNPWMDPQAPSTPRTEEEIFKNLRSTQRNLVRRAQKEGVTIEASPDPLRHLSHFIMLHEETRKRHGFTPYTNAFFRSQVEQFAPKKQLTLYLAHYQGEVIAASIHMHFGGETSYHHGASTHRFQKIPSSYLLQWTAIQDALKRGDNIYNFWGIAPSVEEDGAIKPLKGHPFAGVTLFKTGFGGELRSLAHCTDIPLSGKYYVTRGFEFVRKWKRGF